MTRHLLLSFSLLAPVLAAGCGPTTNQSMDAAVVSFAELNTDIIQPTCAAFDACHSAVGKQAGLDLKTDPYKALVNASTMSPMYPKLRAMYPTLVIPGNAAMSALWIKLDLSVANDPDLGDRMPQSNPALDAATLAKFESWINAGALNN